MPNGEIHNTIIHKSIISEFNNEFNQGNLKQKLASSQIVIETESSPENNLETADMIKEFLELHSKDYGSVTGMPILGKGGEAIVYDLITLKPQEVVAKVPRSSNGNVNFTNLLFET